MNWMSRKQICKHNFYVFSVPKIDMYMCVNILTYTNITYRWHSRERERQRFISLSSGGQRACHFSTGTHLCIICKYANTIKYIFTGVRMG